MAVTKCAPGFKVGQKVKHVAACDGCFPEGTGTVECIHCCNKDGEALYGVKCDKTGEVLKHLFKECELTAV